MSIEIRINPTQERVVERIRQYIVEHDCFRNSPDYEIKEFTVEETDYGTVIVKTTTGRRNDEGTLASCLCRTYRQIFIGPRGGTRAYGKGRTCFYGWTDVMIFGHHN